MSNLSLLTSLILVFAAGLTVGLQIQRIVAAIQKAIEALQEMRQVERKKNTGVVRPGLNTAPIEPVPEAERKSAVVRPRIPVEDPNENDAALQSVRNRTANR